MNEKPNDDENKTSKYSLMAVPENFSEDEISEVESPTNLITDQPSHDQEVKLEHINLERIKEVDYEAEAENHVDKMSNENCEMSEKNSEIAEIDNEESEFIDDQKLQDFKVDVELRSLENPNKVEVEVESEYFLDNESDENRTNPDEMTRELAEFPQDVKTRLGIDDNLVLEDEIQNLKVTLVPIMTSNQINALAPFHKQNLPRPQSPVCDFIQKVLLESYV